MNRIDTSQVVDPAIQQPWTTKSLNFLQDSINGTLGNVIHGLGYAQTDATLPIVVWGMSKNYLNIVSAGAFYGGSNRQEVFTYPGGTDITGMVTPTLVPDFSNDMSVDPVIFSDGFPRNVHTIRKYKIVDIGSGTLPANSYKYNDFQWPNLPMNGFTIPYNGTASWNGAVKCIKVNNIVYLGGWLDCVITTSSGRRPALPSCGIPAAFAPGTAKYFSVPYFDPAGNFLSTIFQISTTGAFSIPGGLQADLPLGASNFYFDGISYYSDFWNNF